MKEHLFTYGTLLDQYAPREIAAMIKKLKPAGKGYIFARLYDLGEYPGAVLDSSRRYKVFGKILELPADRRLLKQLDSYEAFNPERPAESLFLRKRATIHRTNERSLTGWVYVYNGSVDSAPIIEQGRYSKMAV
jgi:gamma-glutamylcyclotransferase (GGCT)/AIG2-like uncharacterized protein YtfP